MPEYITTLFGRKKFHPVIQALAILVVATLGIFIFRTSSGTEKIEWYITASAILLYATANPIIGIFSKKWLMYILFSVVCFAILMTLLIFITNSLAVLKIDKLVEFRLIFIAEAIFYLLITFLIAIFRSMVVLLQKLS